MNPVEIEIRKTQRQLLHRVVCEEFAHKMAARLDDHAHIGNFLEWTPSPLELCDEIRHRLILLEQQTDRRRISADCADIANALLRYSQLYGS